MKMASLKSSLKMIEKEISIAERKLRNRAAIHVRDRIREKISGPGPSAAGSPPGKHSGNLKKGIRIKDLGQETLVGAMAPAWHAHLLEFGTDERFLKSGKSVGGVKPRPFIFPTFEEEKSNVQQILSEAWL
jgi:HK97 gp10 family phage protein